MSPLEAGLILLTGLCTGIFGALLGIGGGALMVPILAILFHIPMHIAIAASLLSVVATSSAAASVFLKSGLTNIRLGMTLEMFTTAGGLVGALIAVGVSERVLQYIFAAVLVATAIGMWKRPHESVHEVQGDRGQLGAEYFDRQLQRNISYRVERLPLGCFISLCAGALSGLLGIGGGVIKVPTMVLGMKLPLRAASATSDMMIGVTAMASLVIYYAHNHVDLFVAGPVATGTFLGSLLGAHLTTRLHSRVLTALFAVLLMLTAGEMLLRAADVVKG